MVMQCSFPRQIKNGLRSFYVPCGQCLCCRINRTTEWTIRILFEMQKYGDTNCMFVTLTYDDEHLPEDYSLHKEDFQKFMKRLRKDLATDGRKIRYFGCGEYGENPREILPTGFGRPHYHLIIFGMSSFDDYDRSMIVENWPFCADYLFDKKHKGIGTVTSDSIQYVTGYIRKKLLGKSSEVYGESGLVPPFQVQSQGLGLDGFEKYMEDYDNPEFVRWNGHELPIPRYFREKFGIDTSHLVSEIEKSHEEVLKTKFGYSEEDVTRLKRKRLFSGIKASEVIYYEEMRPILAQAHEDKVKQMSMRTRRGI